MNDAKAEAGRQTIEELQQRYQKLNTRKIQADTNLENAKKTLEKLQQEAREKFGTDDVAKLREKLAAMTAENEQKRSKYQAELDRIEGELAEVEQKFSGADEAADAAEEA